MIEEIRSSGWRQEGHPRAARLTRDIVRTPKKEEHRLAQWVTFGAVDAYSDIDLFFIVRDEASIDPLYAKVEEAVGRISRITTSHFVPPGRYYKLEDGGDFFFVDLCFIPVRTSGQYLEAERHGPIVAMFDKSDWLRARPLDAGMLASKLEQRHRELQAWFIVSQSFVRKAMLRGHDAEAVAAYWAYTLRPLAELLRMRYCPVRWDFGWRYLQRDLPPTTYARIRELAFVADLVSGDCRTLDSREK